MRIGIYGGAFNPPHRVHQKIAYDLLNKLDLIIYVPVGDEYKKKELIRSIHRFEMLKLISSDRVIVSNYEIKKGFSYSFETLDYFKSIYQNDEIVLIIGEDNYKNFSTWKNYQYILDNYSIIIITRVDDISSNMIRKKIKSNEDVSSYLDDRVLDYIRKKNLYGD